MADAATIEADDRRPGDAWKVSELAAKWRCCDRQIYDLIALGQLATFNISRSEAKRERGLRVTDEERLRFERSGHSITTEGKP